MKKILILFNVVVLAIAAVILITTLFKKQAQDNVLGARKEAIQKLRCPDCNVILIGIDTLRADHLGSYGYKRDTSPNIDKFAQTGVLFVNAFSQSNKTTPSFMSMFTSLYPSDHGVITVLSSNNKGPIVKINDSIVTLPQILKNYGYKTYGMITSTQLAGELGFDRGFDLYEKGSAYASRDKLISLIAKIKSEKFFIFFHDNGPHDPYIPAAPFDRYYQVSPFGKSLVENYDANPEGVLPIDDEDTVEVKSKKMRDNKRITSESFWSKVDGENPTHVSDLIALYDGEIKHLDEFIGRLAEVLEKNKLLENTIIIFTADHGEEFGEHGQFKHNQLYNELIQVPLIVSWQKIEGKKEIAQKVRTVDIMPTLLDLLGISFDTPQRGISLLPFIYDQSNLKDLLIISMQELGGELSKSYITDNYKFISGPSSPQLYNLSQDPKERQNLAELDPSKVKELQDDLDKTLDEDRFIFPPVPISAELDEDSKENLKSLGY